MNSIDQDKAIKRLREEMKYALSRVRYLERQVERLKDMEDNRLNANHCHNWPE